MLESITRYRDMSTVHTHLEIITPDDKIPYAMHISTNPNLKPMVPRIGERQSKSEDRTIPRVCVCNALIDCMNGYQAINHDYLENSPLPKKNTDFRGGWYIYHIPFTYALLPDKSLVGDQELTNEYWLVSYSDDTKSYNPERIGKFFLTALEKQYRDDKSIYNLTLYIENDRDIYLYKDIILSSGKHKALYTYSEKDRIWSVENVDYTTITDKEYYYIKDKTVSLLSHHEKPFVYW